MNLDEVTYCGLYCGLCASRRRIPRQAAALRDALRREGCYDRGDFDLPGRKEIFAPFAEGLNYLADTPCTGCRAGGGYPTCAVRACAGEREVTACPLCIDFPCQRVEMLRNYPAYQADARRMQQVGLEQWIAEQEGRAETGFAYADIRFPREVNG